MKKLFWFLLGFIAVIDSLAQSIPSIQIGIDKAKSVDDVAVDDSVLMSDMHASADYRAHLITQMTKRAVAAC